MAKMERSEKEIIAQKRRKPVDQSERERQGCALNYHRD
jgi:hypothetical protein